MQCSSKSHKLKSCLKSCAYFPLGAVLLYILHNNRLKKTSLFAKKKKKNGISNITESKHRLVPLNLFLKYL